MTDKIVTCAFMDEMAWASNMYVAPLIFDGNINNLQQIYSQFKFDGLEYGSSEHLFQSLKTTNDKDKEFVRTAASPKISKKNGRKIFIRMDWESVKIDAMRLALYLKFYHNPELLEKLIKTGNQYLEETNWWNDTFWGVYYKTGKGENWLGRLLMELRSNLQLLWRIK